MLKYVVMFICTTNLARTTIVLMFEMRLVFICTTSLVPTVTPLIKISLPEILSVVIFKALKTPGKRLSSSRGYLHEASLEAGEASPQLSH